MPVGGEVAILQLDTECGTFVFLNFHPGIAIGISDSIVPRHGRGRQDDGVVHGAELVCRDVAFGKTCSLRAGAGQLVGTRLGRGVPLLLSVGEGRYVDGLSGPVDGAVGEELYVVDRVALRLGTIYPAAVNPHYPATVVSVARQGNGCFLVLPCGCNLYSAVLARRAAGEQLALFSLFSPCAVKVHANAALRLAGPCVHYAESQLVVGQAYEDIIECRDVEFHHLRCFLVRQRHAWLAVKQKDIMTGRRSVQHEGVAHLLLGTRGSELVAERADEAAAAPYGGESLLGGPFYVKGGGQPVKTDLGSPHVACLQGNCHVGVWIVRFTIVPREEWMLQLVASVFQFGTVGR